ncbi:peptidase S8 and S53 subtilisin kexin sedolisin [Beutenbergia cavernae DSM 12333]|uniref:Peptidase S8 and S53 subtilisin kexin sedolisin n=1 Tax=Beutenbergia cavernae (strain ATCC BAA-8 / DSM 12333 / CCUG 43141 / JCM 11478 / NBRC 16432 / NCIMB 13614 / HKI 0122) TaxID=471853 RepID=C5C2W1_BEUC1|nr:S8 family serine peptidase [Beutenbergia cavernae]ACQ81805.1 peptidase S8 and S53 subtilisin kexin sedolisin [Beutenbergia cavernae DSM 12333]
MRQTEIVPRGVATRRRAATALAAAATTALLIGVAAPPASADWDTSLGGLWYFSETGVPQAHQSATGAGVTIALLDSPVNVEVPTLAGADIRTQPDYVCPDEGTPFPGTSTGEEAEHGTAMAELLVGNGAEVGGFPSSQGIAPEATILSYVTVINDRSCTGRVDESVRAAVAAGADIISMSFSGAFTEDNGEAFAEALRAGVVIVNAMPNDPPSELGWPATANGIVSVEAHDINSELMDNPVVSPRLTVVAPGVEIVRTGWEGGAWNAQWLSSGTSEATAFTSGALALVKSAYPEATGNQLIQSLIRTTGGSVQEPARNDDTGYGLISVPALMATDPTTFEDVNPLLRDDPDAVPSIAQIEGTADDGAAGGDAGQAEDAGDADEGPFLLPVLVVLAGFLAVVVVVGLIVVVTRRGQRADRTRSGPQPYPPQQPPYPPGPPPPPPAPPPAPPNQ